MEVEGSGYDDDIPQEYSEVKSLLSCFSERDLPAVTYNVDPETSSSALFIEYSPQFRKRYGEMLKNSVS